MVELYRKCGVIYTACESQRVLAGAWIGDESLSTLVPIAHIIAR